MTGKGNYSDITCWLDTNITHRSQM
jgi:hypothetical protein